MIKKSCAIILSVICGVVVVVFSDSAALSSGNETSVSVPSGYSAGNTLIVEGRDLTYQEAQPPLVTQILLEDNQTAAGYVISGTMFHAIIAELQAVQERLKAKDQDIEILMQQKRELENTVTAERQAKDMLIQERVAVVLEKENLLLEGELTPEEKTLIEETIKRVIVDKVVPIPIIKDPIIVDPIKEEKPLEVKK